MHIIVRGYRRLNDTEVASVPARARDLEEPCGMRAEVRGELVVGPGRSAYLLAFKGRRTGSYSAHAVS